MAIHLHVIPYICKIVPKLQLMKRIKSLLIEPITQDLFNLHIVFEDGSSCYRMIKVDTIVNFDACNVSSLPTIEDIENETCDC